MLTPIHEEHMDEVHLGAARDALKRIQEKMAAQQIGEAFDGFEMPELPKCLKVSKDHAAKVRSYNEAHPIEQQAAWSVGSGRRWDQKVEPEFEKQLIDEADAEKKKLTGDKTKGKTKEQLKAEAAERRAQAKAKAEAARLATSAKPPGEQWWDTAACKWRPIGYMSARKYASLIAHMPSDAHRKAFIEMFGHTQADEARDPPAKVLEARRKAERKAVGAAEPKAKGKAPKAAKPKRAASTAPRRGPNPVYLAKVEVLLYRPEGATLGEIGSLMGWQEHSASAFLSGIRKTRTIAKTVEARGNVYRLEATQ